jgi:hypothetical protein
MGRPSILILPASHAVMTGITAMRLKAWADQSRYRQSFVISAAVEGLGAIGMPAFGILGAQERLNATVAGLPGPASHVA